MTTDLETLAKAAQDKGWAASETVAFQQAASPDVVLGLLERERRLTEALHGVSTSDDCWCDSDPADGGHTLQCLQARALLEQP